MKLYHIVALIICFEDVHGFLFEWFRNFQVELKEYDRKRADRYKDFSFVEREEEKAAELAYRKIHGSVFDAVDWNFGSNFEYRNDDEERAK